MFSADDPRRVALERVNNALQAARVWDDLTESSLAGTLLQIEREVSPAAFGELSLPLRCAVADTTAALGIPFSSPILEAWSSWPGRAEWVQLEVRNLEATVRGEGLSKESQRHLHSLRARYAADEDGWPHALYDLDDRERFRRDCAFTRVAAYQEANWERPAPEQLGAFIATHSRYPFAALKGVSETSRAQIAEHLSVVLFESTDELPEFLLARHKEIEARWLSISDRFDPFSEEELKSACSRRGAVFSCLRWKDSLLAYGVTFIGSDSFLPQTQKKLEHFNELILPRRLDVLAWQYFSSRDPRVAFTLRQLGVDWYQMYQEVVADILIDKGKEILLAIAD